MDLLLCFGLTSHCAGFDFLHVYVTFQPNRALNVTLWSLCHSVSSLWWSVWPVIYSSFTFCWNTYCTYYSPRHHACYSEEHFILQKPSNDLSAASNIQTFAWIWAFRMFLCISQMILLLRSAVSGFCCSALQLRRPDGYFCPNKHVLYVFVLSNSASFSCRSVMSYCYS